MYVYNKKYKALNNQEASPANHRVWTTRQIPYRRAIDWLPVCRQVWIPSRLPFVSLSQ